MIRAFQEADLDRTAEIWLTANLEAHDFIPASYWRDRFPLVRELLSRAELYVYEDEAEVRGFIGLNGDYIEGLFVAREARSRGIGKRLLDFVKDRREELCLSVYRKNRRAVCFYQREGFVLRSEAPDGDTGEKEYKMSWRRT